MSVAYVDTSAVVAIVFGEPGGSALARRLAGFDELVAGNLLEAELMAAFEREAVPFEPASVAGIAWVLPDRPLGRECRIALDAGYLRGADLWHVACALYLAPDPRDLAFVTMDERQRDVAGRLGFGV